MFFAGIISIAAQSTNEYKDLLKSGLKISTKEIVYNQILLLTPAEQQAFDKVFDTYLEKRAQLAEERIPILKEYALNAKTMSEDELNKFNSYIIKSDKKLNCLNKRYYKKSKRVIPIHKATKLFLVEKYLRNEIELEIIEAMVVN